MTAVQPDVHPEGRYNAKETAMALGVSRETLRKWVNSGKIRQRVSRTTARPRYLGRDILALWRSEY